MSDSEQHERTVRLHATVDHYESKPFEFDVTVEASPGGQLDELAKAAALVKLAEFFKSRVGSRVPWPSKRLIVEFDDSTWAEQVTDA